MGMQDYRTTTGPARGSPSSPTSTRPRHRLPALRVRDLCRGSRPQQAVKDWKHANGTEPGAPDTEPDPWKGTRRAKPHDARIKAGKNAPGIPSRAAPTTLLGIGFPPVFPGGVPIIGSPIHLSRNDAPWPPTLSRCSQKTPTPSMRAASSNASATPPSSAPCRRCSRGRPCASATDHYPLSLLQQLKNHFGENIQFEYLARNPGEIVIDFHIVP